MSNKSTNTKTSIPSKEILDIMGLEVGPRNGKVRKKKNELTKIHTSIKKTRKLEKQRAASSLIIKRATEMKTTIRSTTSTTNLDRLSYDLKNSNLSVSQRRQLARKVLLKHDNNYTLAFNECMLIISNGYQPDLESNAAKLKITSTLEETLNTHSTSCIRCQKTFDTLNSFNHHYKDVHVCRSTKTNKEELESFTDKWIRLFSENGYNSAVVEAFKRDATNQNMTAMQIQEFLSVCKPSKHSIEAITITEQPTTIAIEVEATVAPVAYDSSYTHALSDSIEEALFADRTVRTRTNQNDFKERVSANFCYRCAITDSGEALEAAHIEPVGTGNNNTSNGVLMLACLHRLFDAGLMAINPKALTVHFKVDCTYFAKSMLEGKKLCEHSVPLNKKGLLERWISFIA